MLGKWNMEKVLFRRKTTTSRDARLASIPMLRKNGGVIPTFKNEKVEGSSDETSEIRAKDMAPLLFIWILTGAASSQGSADGGRNRAIRCFEQIMDYGDVTNLLIDVTTPEAIDNFCRRHADLLKCTRDHEHSMTVQETSEYQKNISGVNNFYVQLCPPGTDITADYKENAACFRRVAPEILYCGSDLPDVNSYRMRNDLRHRCCALDRHRKCIQSNVRESCGEPAAEVAGKILVRYFDRQIKFCKTPSGGDCETDDSGRTTHVRPSEKDRRGATPSPDREWDWNDATVWKEGRKHHRSGGAPGATLAVAACSLVALGVALVTL